MITLRFRAEAEADLREIADYYGAIDPGALGNVMADIERALQLIERHPQIGMRVPGRSFRRLVSRRYHFKVAYEVASASVTVLGIFRYQDRES